MESQKLRYVDCNFVVGMGMNGLAAAERLPLLWTEYKEYLLIEGIRPAVVHSQSLANFTHFKLLVE